MAHAHPDDFQNEFATALLDPSAAVPHSVSLAAWARALSGFAVYRNNVIAGFIKAMGQRYPVVRRLAGEESFDAVAHRYVLAYPPRTPVLIAYGGEFPRFVRSLGNETMYQYLADIAELEWLRGRAYHAADADPVARDTFSSLMAQPLDAVRFHLHPSLSLIRSRFPIVTIWTAESECTDGEWTVIRQWGPEYALVARPYLDVQVRRLSAGEYAFVQALSERAPLAVAAAAGAAASPAFDLAGAFKLLIESDIVTGFAEPTA